MNATPGTANSAERYDIATVRQLLRAAFTAEDLRRFCQDRPAFRPILADLGSDPGLNKTVDVLISYCQTHDLFDELLAEVKEVNPRQYARFEPDLPIPAEELAKIPCPYRGLEPFEAEHAEFYFGREAMVKQLVAKVKAHSFVAVVGPSGCGKSSLVRAGLVTALCDGALPGSQDWVVRIFRPGSDPLRALSALLIELLEPQATRVVQLEETRRLADKLRDGTVPMADVAAGLWEAQPDMPRLLLIADQFEEVYTECRDEVSPRAFVRALLAAAEGAKLTVILALRADFYGHVLANPQLGKAMESGQINVHPMNEDELRAAIEQPAFKTDRAFEPGLVERILEDVAGEPGDLPLLEFALTELWAQQTSRGLLTHDAYTAIGEVEGAIARRAEAIYQELAAQGQGETVRRVFLRLTHFGEATEGTRRRATLDDLVTPRMPRQEVERVIKALADARLLVTGGVEGTEAATAEVSHEALIRNWEQLRRWLAEDRAFGLWREKLGSAQRIWEETAGDEGALLRGAPLSEAESWLAERGEDLNEAERTFIEESLALREREAAEGAEQKRKEDQLAVEQRTAGRLRRLARGLGASVLIAIVLAGASLVLLRIAVVQRDARATEVAVRSTAEGQAIVERDARGTEAVNRATAEAEALLKRDEAANARNTAVAAQATAEIDALARATAQVEAEQQRDQAEVSRREAEALKLAFASLSQLEENHELALLLAIEAGKTSHSLETDSALWSSFGHRGYTLRILTGHEGSVEYVAWSPDEQRIVTAGSDGTARVWDAESGAELVVLTGHEGRVYQAAWSPDGQRIVTAGYDGTARVWDAESGAELVVLTGHTGSVYHSAWSPDGKRIVTAGYDGTARVWNAESGAELAVLTGHEGYVGEAVWSPDGKRIVTASHDGTARVWDAENGAELTVLTGHEGSVSQAAWSSDGKRIVTAGRDGTARVWDAESGAELIVLTGHTDSVTRAAWSPDAERIVTASDDGTARVWDAESGAELAVLTGHVARVAQVAWSPDGQRIATASDDGTARIYYLPNDDLLAVACQRAVRNMSEEEWKRYMGDLPYRETCLGKPVPGRDF
jgi:Tol biopolymer transport system component